MKIMSYYNVQILQGYVYNYARGPKWFENNAVD